MDMSMYSTPSTQQPAAICSLKSPVDAIHVLEAVRLGLVPRVTRRLTGHERSMIRAGTVWVWEEEETNMRRWTDGRKWGASRVGGGGFLVYTESWDSNLPPTPTGESPSGSAYNSPTYSHHGQNGFYNLSGSSSSSKKPDSLIKQTYSTTMTHPVTGKVKKFHVVGYSSKLNPQSDAVDPFSLPHQLPLLANLKITPGIWPEWEQRRESDLAASRPMSGRPIPSSSRSAPVTALPSPSGLSADNLGLPTTFPSPRRPPSPGRESYPPARQYGNPPVATPAPPNDMRHLSTPYNQPFFPPPSQHDLYDSQRQMYAGRAMSQPNKYPLPHPVPTQQTHDRYHPYQAPIRPNRPSPYPSSDASMSSGGLLSPYSSLQNSYYEGDRSRSSRERDGHDGPQTAPPHPYQPYPYPPNQSVPRHHSGPVHQRRDNEQHQDSFIPAQYPTPGSYYRDEIRQLESPYRDPVSNEHYPDGRRTPADYTYRPQSVPQPPRLDHLQPPRVGSSAATSPKMSIPSALLNPSNVTSGGLTLPPLRLAIDDPGTIFLSRNASPSAQMGKISPRSISESGSVSSSQGMGMGMEGRGWKEDVRQLGELGKRVSRDSGRRGGMKLKET